MATAAAGVVGLASPAHARAAAPVPLPRWRGFNLLEKFNHERSAPFRESDFQIISDWGFNFARLPMSYRCWADPDQVFDIREAVIEEIDQAVEYGRRHGVHVNLNFHRIPGYCVNPPPEPWDLWTDARAQEAAAFHWRYLAERYRGIGSDRVSFDLVNEPARIDEPTYARVMEHLIRAIRAADPERLIIVDGLRWGRDPVHGLVGARVGQSTRGYDPMVVSHHRASWVDPGDWPEPTWPLRLDDGTVWDKERLRREIVGPWRELAARGVGVHVGEWGAHNRTPHQVALAWMRDFLELWQEAGWGWALWNLRGSFGVLDSGRTDVAYQPFRGHQLDQKMLELLRSH